MTRRMITVEYFLHKKILYTNRTCLYISRNRGNTEVRFFIKESHRYGPSSVP